MQILSLLCIYRQQKKKSDCCPFYLRRQKICRLWRVNFFNFLLEILKSCRFANIRTVSFDILMAARASRVQIKI